MHRKNRSTDARSKAGTLNTGWYGFGKPFMANTQISDVIATDFGYHLVLVTQRKAGQPTKFEEIKETVKEVYGNKLREAVIAQMKARAQIQITPRQ